MQRRTNIPKTYEVVARFRRIHVRFFTYFFVGLLPFLGVFLIEGIFRISPRWSDTGKIVGQWYHIPFLVLFIYCLIRALHIGFTQLKCPNCSVLPSLPLGGVAANPKRCSQCDFPLSIKELEKDLALEKLQSDSLAKVQAARNLREANK